MFISPDAHHQVFRNGMSVTSSHLKQNGYRDPLERETKIKKNNSNLLFQYFFTILENFIFGLHIYITEIMYYIQLIELLL